MVCFSLFSFCCVFVSVDLSSGGGSVVVAAGSDKGERGGASIWIIVSVFLMSGLVWMIVFF